MTIRPALGALALGLVAALGVADAQQAPRPAAKPQTPRAPGHGDHGTPAGWKFKWPKGDAAKGRQVFAKFECYSCHEVKGEKFPAPTDKGKVGPELSMMGPLHDAFYFAEAIINPSATIEPGKPYAGADGSSKMPSYNDSMLVQEVVDLVAFLQSLKPVGTMPAGHKGH
jgi:cytochrome c1